MKKTMLLSILLCVLLTTFCVAETCDLTGLAFDIPNGFIPLGEVDGATVYMDFSTNKALLGIGQELNGMSIADAISELINEISNSGIASEGVSDYTKTGYPYVCYDINDNANSLYGKAAVFYDKNKVYMIMLGGDSALTELETETFNNVLETVKMTSMATESTTKQDEAEQSSLAKDTQSTTTYETLQIGDKGDFVKTLQLRLIELSYLDGNADGEFGNKTKAAVQLFQQSVGLPANGVADDETQKSLFASDAPKAKTYKELDYKELSRNPDAHIDECYTFSGIVLQVMEEAQEDGTTLATYRIATKNNYDNVVYVGYCRPQGEKRILEDDNVVVYAQSRGLISYQTVMGDVLSIPGFLAESISFK